MLPHLDDDKHLSKLDLLVKGVGAILMSAAIAFYGVHSQTRQFETAERNRRSQVLVQTISSREAAASDMRAKMFDTLVQHYFGNVEDDRTKVVILEMIGHNFENDLNLKPLFLRLDAELGEKNSEQREILQQTARDIARSQISQILGARGEVCSLELRVGEPREGGCIAPLTFTLQEVREDQVVVREAPSGDETTLTWFDMPLVNNRTLGELRYALVLTETDPRNGKATLQAVRLPSSLIDVENRLRVDRLIEELTLQDF